MSDVLRDAAGHALLDALGAYLDDDSDVLIDAGYAPLFDDDGKEIEAG